MAVSHDLGWLAFDIGAKTHTWACDIGGVRETGKVDNTPSELRALLTSCATRAKCLRVLVEATGVCYLDVAMLAHELGAEVMVVNPRVAHHFAKALNQRNKTDKLDAKMLLECLKGMPFNAWEPPRQSWLELRDYARFLVQLTEAGVAARNRLHALSANRRALRSCAPSSSA